MGMSHVLFADGKEKARDKTWMRSGGSLRVNPQPAGKRSFSHFIF